MKKEDKPEQCEACGFDTENLQSCRMFNKQGEEYYLWFCDLCINTKSAISVMYPSNSLDISDVLKTLCYLGNVIIRRNKN